MPEISIAQQASSDSHAAANGTLTEEVISYRSLKSHGTLSPSDPQNRARSKTYCDIAFSNSERILSVFLIIAISLMVIGLASAVVAIYS